MFLNLYLLVVSRFEAALHLVAGPLRPSRNARLSPAVARGVTFIEYALLAGIAIAIAIIFRKTLSSTFSSILGSFQHNATCTTTTCP